MIDQRGPEQDADSARRAGIVADLLAVFDGLLPRRVVLDEIGRAERELRGQIPAGARAEMLHRLAAHRLGRRVAAR